MARPTQTSDEAVVCALAAHPEVTSAQLAEVLGIGQSTAAKRLAALEAAGSVRRVPGGREGGRRAPDRWAVTDRSQRATDVATVDALDEVPEEAGDIPAAVEHGEGEPDRAAPAPAVSTAAARGRLGRGELGSMVRAYLADRPDEAFGPAAVGKALGRSQGAISNSLAAMAASGEVVLVGDKPRRYRIATTG